MQEDRNARQGQAVEVCGGTQTEIQDRTGWISSGERPDGREEIGSCH